ncbi:hypothetical protein IRJ41_003777 [Triplophysa rosa]|uniref:Uncharacterized protein n=1 Tax=Triplophysa rosa TaxID=992332 RepID=A0A9W7X4P9_TRIRA|nr:hypothetical protein IRJ41_003777 [Triplophysa rosa]
MRLLQVSALISLVSRRHNWHIKEISPVIFFPKEKLECTSRSKAVCECQLHGTLKLAYHLAVQWPAEETRQLSYIALLSEFSGGCSTKGLELVASTKHRAMMKCT